MHPSTRFELPRRPNQGRLARALIGLVLAACASTSSSIDRYVVFESHSFK
jgi:hypothetical protein